MTTSRHAAARLHPALFAVLIAFGATALLAALVASLAQASAPMMAPAPAAALAAAPASSAAQTHQAAPAQPLPADATPVEYAPGVVLVKLKPGAAEARTAQGATAAQAGQSHAAAVAGLFQSYGVTGAEPLLATEPAALRATTDAGAAPSALANVYRLRLAPQFDAQQMALALAADPSVEYAEPDYIARAAVVPDDPEFAGQWALAKIGAPAAWDVQTGDPAIVIAVIDSGVDMAHPEFAGRLWENDDPVDGVDNDLNGFIDDTHGWNAAAGSNDLLDANGHGTQVAGVFGAAANNGQGVAGLCWGCKLMFANAMQASGVANYSDIARAVIYASSNGAQVINLSLGGYTDSAALREAIQEASTTAVIVAGAGNDDGSSPFYPAAYPQVLAVAATDPDDQKAIFSNSGAWLDLSAPGLDIRTTALGGGYATESGTSLASAHVAGLAGLVRSQHPQWTPEQVRWQLLNTAADIDAANPTKIGQLGAGRIDAAAALATDPQAQAAVQSATIDGAAGVRPAPGQSVQLVLSVQNQWLPAQNLQATLTSSDPNVSITDAAGSFGDLMPGQSGSNAADPFAVTISNAASYNAVLNFTLTLSGDGGYRLSLPVTIQVRSAIETLGNTQYTQDTTWTNDKTYVLAGSVIVGQGVTLTIQPGTLVKADPGKFLRIDGTLIASGTAEQPIVFTTNATDNATWSGIRFTASAVDATFDVDGVYTGGSIVRHAGIRRADTGLSLAGRTPYIADSSFTNNSLAIQTWTEDAPGGRVTIERNRFTGNAINVGGGATVLQNEFTADAAGEANGECGIHLSGGSPLIMLNSFTGGCVIGGSAGYPNVVSNTLAGGTIDLSLGGSTAGGSASLPLILQGPHRTQLAAGWEHTCAVLEGGSMQCWGQNWAGQLGTGNNTDADTPQTVVGLAGPVRQLAASESHTCALLENGSVQCWGLNNGQLGTGNNTNANTPQAVVGLAGPVRQLAAGGGDYSMHHTCAVLEGGSVQCWGSNYYGQLGTGNNNGATTPQAVIGLAGVAREVAAGLEHVCALLESGSVQCWG